MLTVTFSVLPATQRRPFALRPGNHFGSPTPGPLSSSTAVRGFADPHGLVPVRWPRIYPKQKFVTGAYMTPARPAIAFEGRAVRSAVEMFDFLDVPLILAHPVEVTDTDTGESRVPDLLVVTGTKPTTVDVVNAARTTGPKVSAVQLMRRFAEHVGWRHAVVVRPPLIERDNISYLLNYRRLHLTPHDVRVLTAIRKRVRTPMAFAEAASVVRLPHAVGRGFVLHLLGRRLLTADLSQHLTDHTIVAPGNPGEPGDALTRLRQLP